MKWLGLVLVYVVLPLLLTELTEIAPWLAVRLLRSSTRLLPREHRDRYELEWLGELDAVPGKLFKLLFAIQISVRVFPMKRELNGAEPIWVRLARRVLTVGISAALAVARLASRVLARRLGRLPPSEYPIPRFPRIEQALRWLGLVEAAHELSPSQSIMPKRWVRQENSVPLDTPIEELDLSARSYNSLKRSGVATIGDLLAMTADDPTRRLLKIRNFGRSSLEELQEKLIDAGWDHQTWD